MAQGCGSCHTLAAANAHGTFGPDLGASLAGTPAAAIRRSIVDPGAEAAAGYETGMMPEDYATRITPRDLDRLVAFLRAARRLRSRVAAPYQRLRPAMCSRASRRRLPLVLNLEPDQLRHGHQHGDAEAGERRVHASRRS